MKSESAPHPPLPFLPDLDHAQAASQTQHDPFLLTAFFLQRWLIDLTLRATAEYAQNKNPAARSLQLGEAWRALGELFNTESGAHFPRLLSSLLRFSLSDNSPRNLIRLALVPLSVEHRCTGDYLGPQTIKTPKSRREANELARRTIVRWCDWLDAAIHLRTHRHWHFAPECFDPDPEKRELAALGNAQRHIATLDSCARAAWLWDFTDASERYKDSPKWVTLGRAMSSQSRRSWPYARVDTLIIALWPIVKAYNWTYRDLLNFIRPALARPHAYPCACEQDFAAYCVNVLGLRKTAKGSTAPDGRPPGYQLARELCSLSGTPPPTTAA